MANKMLIDAAHPEETRVVVLRGNRIEEFDFEAANRKQLRGNIYLAKVTRVEPSLQAAFIEYGGNRHGFLAFSEIHPDYYQIPVADRQALLEEEARFQADEEDEPRPVRGGGDRHGGGERTGGERSAGGERNGDRSGNGRRSRRHRRGDSQPARRSQRADEVITGEEPLAAEFAPSEGGMPDRIAGDAFQDSPASADLFDTVVPHEGSDEGVAGSFDERDDTAATPLVEDLVAVAAASADEPQDGDPADDAAHVDAHDEGLTTLEDGVEAEQEAAGAASFEGSADVEEHGADEHGPEDDVVEQLGGDALEDVPHRVSRPRRTYKIQEVIKRRQVLLVQVVKEERGNKGAALTTYLSLAGRYSVLMPNTAKGGGISRKITDAEDRKRLKAIASELEVPEGMGIILRTAGAARGVAEVKRDFEYLMRMWETVRETTLRSSAPTLVYEEGSLIKRSIRDLFNKDVDEVIVSGDEAYREAKDFMRLLMPSQAKAVVAYRDPQPIFAKAGAEAQLDAMFSSQVTLKSGGYIVINQTEALVAIDVNSGRSTREHNIEDTALRTNLEAADEVARQLRLRDLAGLIVVDFIDMEEGRNDRAVERRMKDALKDDRARIQIGRISHFGLLEMSRQRMRTGVLEGSSVMCAHCAGTGTVRSMSSIALHVLRLIEDALIKSAEFNLVVRTRSEVALYILNHKRVNLLDLESRFGVTLSVMVDVNMTGALYHAIDRGSEATPPLALASRAFAPVAAAEPEPEEEDEEPVADEAEELVTAEAEPAAAEQPAHGHARGVGPEGENGRRRKRRRRRRGGRDGQGAFAERETQGGEASGETEDGEEGDELDQAELTDIASGFSEPVGELSERVEAATATALDEQTDHGTVPPTATEEPASDPVVPADATPGTDDVVAAAPSEPAALADPQPAEPVEEAPRRRRSRRTPRAAEAGAAETAETEPAAPAKRPRRTRARAGEAVADPVPLDREVEADTVKTEAPPAEAPPAEAEPELPLAASAPEQPSASEPEAMADDPDRPKRSGWWQRAKATFGS